MSHADEKYIVHTQRDQVKEPLSVGHLKTAFPLQTVAEK